MASRWAMASNNIVRLTYKLRQKEERPMSSPVSERGRPSSPPAGTESLRETVTPAWTSSTMNRIPQTHHSRSHIYAYMHMYRHI